MSEKELDQLHLYYEKLADLAEENRDIHSSHSIDVAKRNQDYKYQAFNNVMESGFPNKTKPIHKGFILNLMIFKMKYFWIFLLLPFFASSQTHRFVYEYQFKRDSPKQIWKK